MCRYLIYTLVCYQSQYVDMFKVFLQSLLSFSDCSAFDLCIICDDVSAKVLKTLKILEHFNTYYLITCKYKNLFDVLLCKFDIVQHPNFLDYDRVLYLDSDIVVQKNIMDLFAQVRVKKTSCTLHVKATFTTNIGH